IPFLWATPTIALETPPIFALNSVGVDPKSGSITHSDGGTRHKPTTFKSDACSSTTAEEYISVVEHGSALPVAIYISPVLSSIVGEPHTAPPRQPFGTTSKVCLIAPVNMLILKSCPWTVGQSPNEAMPT